ncbi:unnamed protein product, partial [Adineta steineri]
NLQQSITIDPLPTVKSTLSSDTADTSRVVSQPTTPLLPPPPPSSPLVTVNDDRNELLSSIADFTFSKLK